MWSKDTIDWCDKDENLIFERATKNSENGDLILMHPTEATVKALPRIINNLVEKGFKLTTVSENIAGLQKAIKNSKKQKVKKLKKQKVKTKKQKE